ncbi:putative F-box/LRR-repeat protein At1g56400 isoform X3 [Chenopodium quinoa]|uniref:putative F-box/LRR-repeat protein At1g56400 isoform X3 n=1 Tax=Chenopodium quinoa TaxID=63459 RepID=UPI000B77762C|nr:putative F-box/LRR-repeat protein At1g56400 isoform X3 [Chenopodium quinoa]
MDDEGQTCIDRISKLPDFILHHILSYLYTKEAVQLSVISKRWQYVLETFPILDCSEGYFGKDLRVINPKLKSIPKDGRRKIFNQRVEFMSYIDKKLCRFREKNLRVNKFSLTITLVSNKLSPRVDTWMELLAGTRIQELNVCIRAGHGRRRDMSKILFTMESLTILNFQGRVLLSSRLDRNAVKLYSLVELRLIGVSIDEDTIQDLILCCRSMKVFFLMNCVGFENLEICDHDKLEKMVYNNLHRDVKDKKFSIEVPTLKELEITFRNGGEETMVCEIIIGSVCQNLKCLSLRGIPVDAKWLQNTITSFPLLENLHLGGCILQEVIKLSSQALKEICINNCMNLMEAEFDTPNVHSFKYCGQTMPRLYSNSVADYRTALLSSRLEDMDSLWFMKLYNFLSDFRFQDLTIWMIPYSGREISFNAEDYIGIQFPPFELDNMKLFMNVFTSINYAALLDGLFWNLRPRILSLQLLFLSPDVLKGLLKCLVAEEPNCYCSQNLICWRHSLKGIKLINVKGLESNTVLNAITLKNLTNYLDDWVIEAKKGPQEKNFPMTSLSFELSWC